MRKLLQRVRDESGAAIIEFALVAPLLLVLVWGIIETGRAFYTINSLASAVRDGARFGATCNLGAPPPAGTLVLAGTACEAEIRNMVVSAFQPMGPPLTTAQVTPTVVGGNRIRVVATYPYQPITPVPNWRVTVTRTAVFRYERLP